MIPPVYAFVPARLRGGFSLVELIATIAIITALFALAVPAVTSMVEGGSTSRAVEIVSNSVILARQRAMTNRRAVALIVSKSAEQGVAQGVLLLEAPDSDGSSKWIPRGGWSRLPLSARVEIFSRDGVESFYSSSSGMMPEELPLKLDDEAVADYAFVIFYPNGTVKAPAEGPAITLHRWGRSAVSPDYTLVIQSESGRVKVIPN